MIFPCAATNKGMRMDADFVAKKLGKNISNIIASQRDDKKNIHCENLIGAVSIPVGVAGPLIINGDYTNGDYYVPLATTEGALVASVNRGYKVIGLSGGVNVNINRVGTTRGPVFYVESHKDTIRFITWLQTNERKIAQITEQTSSHLKLIKIETKNVGNYVYVRLYFNTDQAMGMNMVTIATQKFADYAMLETKTKCLTIAGNYDIDKKPAWLNFINGRGFQGWGEIIIKEKIINKILKTTSQKIFDVWLAKCMIGSAMSGSMGFNAHYANIVAAFFAATGQDLAHIVEGSMGVTTTKVLENKDLYFSVYLPALMLGMVGGGTKLKTQAEARQIIGVNKIEQLVEVLVGTVLAGELSLLASLAEGTLAGVHKKFGR